MKDATAIVLNFIEIITNERHFKVTMASSNSSTQATATLALKHLLPHVNCNSLCALLTNNINAAFSIHKKAFPSFCLANSMFIFIAMFTSMPMSIHNFPGSKSNNAPKLEIKLKTRLFLDNWWRSGIAYKCSERYGLLRLKWHNQFYCEWENNLYDLFVMRLFVLFTLVFCCCYVVISLQLLFFLNHMQKNN